MMTRLFSLLNAIPAQFKLQLLARLERNAAREVLAKTYDLNTGDELLAMIGSHPKANGLAWLSLPMLGLEEKLHALQCCADVHTDDMLHILFNRGEGDDRLLPKLTRLYATGQLSRKRARTFQEAGKLSQSNPEVGAQATEFRRLVWERS